MLRFAVLPHSLIRIRCLLTVIAIEAEQVSILVTHLLVTGYRLRSFVGMTTAHVLDETRSVAASFVTIWAMVLGCLAMNLLSVGHHLVLMAQHKLAQIAYPLVGTVAAYFNCKYEEGNQVSGS